MLMYSEDREQTQSGQSKYVLYDYNSRKGTGRDMAFVRVQRTGYRQWGFYYSAVGCSRDEFDVHFPVLLKIWQSWKVDGRVFTARLQDAARKFQEAGNTSAVAAPPGKLEINLPVLLEIWSSWETDTSVFQRRIQQAIRDMNIATNTMQATIDARNRSVYNSSVGWSEYIRGIGHFLDTENNTLYEMDIHRLPEFVERLNDAAGSNKFRKVYSSEW